MCMLLIVLLKIPIARKLQLGSLRLKCNPWRGRQQQQQATIAMPTHPLNFLVLFSGKEKEGGEAWVSSQISISRFKTNAMDQLGWFSFVLPALISTYTLFTSGYLSQRERE